ncbi:hypothetical protein Tco_1275522 [Tanacetum coccineum]
MGPTIYKRCQWNLSPRCDILSTSWTNNEKVMKKPLKLPYKLRKSLTSGAIDFIGDVPVFKTGYTVTLLVAVEYCQNGLKQRSSHTNDARVVHDKFKEKSWPPGSDKLDDAFWLYRPPQLTKHPSGVLHIRLCTGRHVNLPIELEHKAYWALKHTNFDIQTAGDKTVKSE